jgi:c-di-GMP-binding flagellar brake protein YcgR
MLKKRKFPRIDQNWQLKYRKLEKHVDQGSPLSSLAINLSGGGVCFTTRDAVTPDSLLALEIEAPELKMPIIAMARAVWCKKRHFDDLFDLGCEFYWVGWKDDSAQKSLADYIKNQTARAENAARVAEN